MSGILQILFHLIFAIKKSDFTGEQIGTQIAHVNPHRADTAPQFCLTSSPGSFQLFEAVSCEKNKKQKNT